MSHQFLCVRMNSFNAPLKVVRVSLEMTIYNLFFKLPIQSDKKIGWVDGDILILQIWTQHKRVNQSPLNSCFSGRTKLTKNYC